MPPAAYPTLREVFLRRVIQIEAVQRERDAAMEEARGAGATIPPDIVELFFDHGMLPGGQNEPWSPYWSVTTEEPPAPPAPPTWMPETPSWATGPHEPQRLPTPRLGPVLTFTAAVERALRSLPLFSTPALERAVRPALAAWAALVRELRAGTIQVTGDRDNRRQILGAEAWLSPGLLYDVRANAIVDRDLIRHWTNLQVRKTAVPGEVKKRRGPRGHAWDNVIAAVLSAQDNGDTRPVTKILATLRKQAKTGFPDPAQVRRHRRQHPDLWAVIKGGQK